METDLWVVRLYDGFDNKWIDLSEPVSLSEADRIWKEKTQDGTKNICYNDIDYYKIFPADTKMVFTWENSEEDDDSNTPT